MAEQREQQRRSRQQPVDLQGLLQLAIEATRNEDGARASPLQPMDEERRQFLEDAVNNLTVNITNELQNGINLLSNEQLIRSLTIETSVPQEIMDQFDNLEDHVSQIDNAIGFYKLGGFSVFPICLTCEHPAIRSSACTLIGELCQNNPFCQAKVLECGYLQILMNMINNEQEHEVLLKAFFGISSIIRHYDPSIAEFFENDGCGLLKKIFEGPHMDMQNKAVFLINAIYPDNREIAEKLITAGVLESMILAFPKTYHPLCNQIFKTLGTLLMYNDPIVANELNNPIYELRKNIMHYCENEYNCDMDYSEEITSCRAILAVLRDKGDSSMSGSDESVSNVDR